MAFKLSHITDIDVLKSFSGPNLKALFSLSPEFTLPTGADGKTDFKKLVEVLLEPQKLPQKITSALYYIDALATPAGSDALQDAVAIHAPDLKIECKNTSCADCILQVWLSRPDLVKRVLAESSVESIQATDSFYGRDATGLKSVSKAKIKAIAEAMDRWFTSKRRGTGTEISRFDKMGTIWFVVRRGDAFRREAVINQKTKASESNFGYPEIHDILIYDPEFNELRIHANGVAIKKEYRRVFGLELFGDGDYFTLGKKFTLVPLLKKKGKAINHAGIPGILGSRLTRIEYPIGNAQKEMVCHSSDDIFASFAEREGGIDNSVSLSWSSIPQLSSATIKLDIGECDGLLIGERSVRIIPPNRALYKRDGALPLIEQFLIKNEFVLNRAEAADAESDS